MDKVLHQMEMVARVVKVVQPELTVLLVQEVLEETLQIQMIHQAHKVRMGLHIRMMIPMILTTPMIPMILTSPMIPTIQRIPMIRIIHL